MGSLQSPGQNTVGPINWAAIQTIVTFLAFLGAVIIGFQQNSINQKLLDLAYLPSISTVYNQQNKHLEIYNRGDKSILISYISFQDKFSDNNKNNERITISKQDMRNISPGDFYFFLIDNLEPIINKYLEEIGKNGEANIPFKVHLTTLNQDSYIANCLLYIRVTDGAINIYTQTVSIFKD